MRNQIINDDNFDDHVDTEIENCFHCNSQSSFFVFAGAGSGKTRSLINTLAFLDHTIGYDLYISSKQVAIITYTNAACDEISRRMEYKSIFGVSTIHSFLWELIKNYQSDIMEWIKAEILSDIKELEEKQARGRVSAAQEERTEKILKNKKRLANIDQIKKFSYNPNGENYGYDSLNHSEVVRMGSDFIATKEIMQRVLVSKYPILLIDESQDTKKELIDALLIVYEKFKDEFVIGMFGDTMQKIYMDGKDNLANYIPNTWVKPTKIMNHRSAVRIIELANAIRISIDGQQQKARSDAEPGKIRLFIANSEAKKSTVEQVVIEMMAKETGDDEWLIPEKRKSLILEHHMAASRLGFADLYFPLKDVKSFDNALRDGNLPELSFLSNIVRPLVNAHKNNNEFEITRILRQHSPLLNRKAFNPKIDNQMDLIITAEKKVNELLTLWDNEAIPTCIDVLRTIRSSGLFELDDRVDDILDNSIKETADIKITALREALAAPFTQLERYSDYVSGNTQFATHQGIKGLEFPRVVVIIDDVEARGFLFSYEKLFGATEKTATDLKNELEGKDTGIARTTRLFYVACTRAQKSLAVVVYTGNISSVQTTAISNNWFKVNEITIL